jgi:4-hydroxybenzoate polyprenyltransferase
VNLHTFLSLGRTSNLPTVWTNILAGAVLANAAGPATIRPVWFALVLLGASFFYVGGMWLNDAFDAEWDAANRPERPIPAHRASLAQVTFGGFTFLAAGFLLISWRWFATGDGGLTIAAGAVTVLAILAYDRWHKGVAWAPALMGLCRAGVYAMAALSVTSAPTAEFWTASLALWAYIVGLTHIARFETGSVVTKLWLGGVLISPAATAGWLFASDASPTPWLTVLLLSLQVGWVLRAFWLVRSGRPGTIGRAVVSLIAGVALVDATFVASSGDQLLAIACLLAFGLTLAAQRRIAGT